MMVDTKMNNFRPCTLGKVRSARTPSTEEYRTTPRVHMLLVLGQPYIFAVNEGPRAKSGCNLGVDVLPSIGQGFQGIFVVVCGFHTFVTVWVQEENIV